MWHKILFVDTDSLQSIHCNWLQLDPVGGVSLTIATCTQFSLQTNCIETYLFNTYLVLVLYFV